MKTLKVALVNYEQALGIDAILTKYARSMERELIDLGYEVIISDKPVKGYINHHINYVSYIPSGEPETTMITHLTGDKNQSEEEKIEMVKKQKAHGICMNKEMKEKLVKAGVPKEKLSVIYQAHDSLKRRPRIITICSNVYPDGRKREDMFVELFKTLNPKEFIFRFIGNGWAKVIEKCPGIQAEGSEKFMADLYSQFLSTSDFLLYTGDEDSLAQSLIDAKQVGLRIIAPPREEFEIEYPFNSQKELNKIFEKMGDNPVKDWTWDNYTLAHCKIWELMYNKKYGKEDMQELQKSISKEPKV